MSCKPATYDICVLQNATFRTGLVLTDDSGSYIDITSWSFVGTIKEMQQSSLTIVADIAIDVVDPISASLEVIIYPISSSLLTKRQYYYDIIATNILPNPDEVYRIIQGKVSVNPAVTSLTDQ